MHERGPAVTGPDGGGLVRWAGWGRTAAGETVWWSVAEGRRGRRWREAVVTDGGLRHSLLLETSPDGRFSHLELSTPAGLLTLHPEGDGALHGNALVAGGLRHVEALPWDPDGLVMLDGSPVARATAAHLLARTNAPDTPGRRRVLRISGDLDLASGIEDLKPLGDGGWRPVGGPDIIADALGLPILLDALSWPLELAE
jgi:hypothetical protein